ncbi:hypothetical protein Tco_1275620 [Tanacetum coccineum]
MKAVRSSSYVSMVPSLNSEEFMNVLVRVGFGSTIKLVSFDSDNTVNSPHGFAIHGIEVLKGNEKVMEVIDVENWRIDNSRMLRRIVSLIEQNSFVSSTKSPIQRTFRFRKRKVLELEPKVRIPGLECNRSLPEGIPFVNNLVIKPSFSLAKHASASKAVSIIQTKTPTITQYLPFSAPQDRWSRDKHIKLVNIVEEPKKVSEALMHPGWVDVMQEELNQFAVNKVWTLLPLPYGKFIIGSK